MTDTPTERVGEGIWTRLRRRKVVQWGIAYVAGAWGLLQGLAYVTDIFHWPEYIQQIATLALLIGLPIVLVLAWYHGDRGQQRVSTPEFAILTLLLLLGGGAFWYYQHASEPVTNEPSTASTVHPDASAGDEGHPPVDRGPAVREPQRRAERRVLRRRHPRRHPDPALEGPCASR